jgi:hypothetical protein
MAGITALTLRSPQPIGNRIGPQLARLKAEAATKPRFMAGFDGAPRLRRLRPCGKGRRAMWGLFGRFSFVPGMLP